MRWQFVRNSEATAINSSGVIVGDSTTDDGVNYATLILGGKLHDLDSITTGIPSGVTRSFAAGIGPEGTVIGTTCAAPSTCPPGSPQTERSFMLRPVQALY